MPPLQAPRGAGLACAPRASGRARAGTRARAGRPRRRGRGRRSSARRPSSSRTAVRSTTVSHTCSADERRRCRAGSARRTRRWKSVSRFLATSWSRTVLSPSKVVKTSVSAFSAANRLARQVARAAARLAAALDRRRSRARSPTALSAGGHASRARGGVSSSVVRRRRTRRAARRPARSCAKCSA